MKIRKFTEQGHQEYKNLYREIFESIKNKNGNIKKGYTKNLKKKIKSMQENFLTNSIDIGASQEIKNKNFKSAYDLGVCLDNALRDLSYIKIQNDAALWDWIALFFFDQIFTEKMRGFSEYRYILNDDWRFIFRHLTRTPWWCVQYYGEPSKLLLCEEPYKSIDWLEQFIKNREIREFKTSLELCYTMYFDKKTNSYKPGTSKGKQGGLHRLRDKLNQYFCIYDLWHMELNDIIKLLPKEFDRYKPRVLK